MRLIDADALKSWIDCGHLRPPTELCFSELDVVQILDMRPTIDAVPIVYARWIRGETDYDEPYIRCSHCREIWHVATGGIHDEDLILPGLIEDEMLFCPSCGAKMDGEAHDDPG